MGSSRWDVVVGLKYSKWSLANQTSVVLFLDCRQFCMVKTYGSRQRRVSPTARHRRTQFASFLAWHTETHLVRCEVAYSPQELAGRLLWLQVAFAHMQNETQRRQQLHYLCPMSHCLLRRVSQNAHVVDKTSQTDAQLSQLCEHRL